MATADKWLGPGCFVSVPGRYMALGYDGPSEARPVPSDVIFDILNEIPALPAGPAKALRPDPKYFRSGSKTAILARGCPRSTRGGTVARDKHVADPKVPRGVLPSQSDAMPKLPAAAGKAGFEGPQNFPSKIQDCHFGTWPSTGPVVAQ